MYHEHFKVQPYPDNDGMHHDIFFKDCPLCGKRPFVVPAGNKNTTARSLTVKCESCRIELKNIELNYSFDWLYRFAAECWNKLGTDFE